MICKYADHRLINLNEDGLESEYNVTLAYPGMDRINECKKWGQQSTTQTARLQFRLYAETQLPSR